MKDLKELEKIRILKSQKVGQETLYFNKELIIRLDYILTDEFSKN